MNWFYSTDLLNRPEYIYKNQLINLKDTEIEMLENALKNVEADDLRRSQVASAAEST
jgi:hypothetical protein